MTQCKLCFKDITFSSDPQYLSKMGIKKPLDIDPAGVIIGFHECPIWEAQHRQYRRCNKCNKEWIYFDKKQKSINDRWVPISKMTGSPHQCPETKIKIQTSADNTEEEKIAIIKAGITRLKEKRKQNNN